MEKRFYARLQRNEALYQSLFPIGILCLIAEVIWLVGPYVIWGGNAPLASPEKRAYAILVLFLAWLLKFLLIDLGKRPPSLRKSVKPKDKLTELRNRFEGAVHFLRKNTIAKQGGTLCLNDLPWYLLIGPQQAGKTTLLANSQVHFILQKQFQHQDRQHLEASENCDWWATREACIIDVPGKYLSPVEVEKNSGANLPSLWQFFLRLIKKERRKNGIHGLIIVLPAAEIIKQADPKSYQSIVQALLHHINEIQTYFKRVLPCQLILTKCDLLPGFTEFFAESTDDEVTQMWGINLPALKNVEKISDVFLSRFNALIKRTNQQLLWRLHQERDLTAKLYIKDFPLQIERIKEFSLDFIKKTSSSGPKISIQGVYLTSALQPPHENTGNLLEAPPNTSIHEIQIFKGPPLTSRPYFIKQFLAHGLGNLGDPAQASQMRWKRHAVYAASFSIITVIMVMLGRDFLQGIKQVYVAQRELAEYQARTAQIQDPTVHFIETLGLLNTLQSSTKHNTVKTNLFDSIHFYSHRAQQKSNEIYHQALRAILMPEVKNYMEEYLHHPINNEADDVYTALKAYLMIGDAAYFNSDFLGYAMQKIMPSTLSQTDKDLLLEHLKITLNTYWNPVALNANLIQQTRSYLLSLPNLKLSYIILENLDNNNSLSQLNLGTNFDKGPVFISQMTNRIPTMFTSKVFPSIISQETILATQEATHGNWVLGYEINANTNSGLQPPLVDQLRTAYITNYIALWESLLNNIHLSDTKDLTQIDAMVVNLISNNSPLLQLLHTFHDNTYFDPINTTSVKLQNINALLNKDESSQNLLYEIFSSLQSLHAYLQTILGAENEKKAAFDALTSRMLGRGTPDAITQLRLVAEKSPAPIKQWLAKIAANSWNYLLRDAGHYLDISWKNEVILYYQTDISQHYPFGVSASNDVELNNFIRFFGNPGIVYNFYDKYLQPFVDTSRSDWQWKPLDGQTLPFSEVSLRQIQQALRIHYAFFANNDNKLHVQFAMQPYEFGKMIKTVKLNINDTQFIDNKASLKNSHPFTWPSNQNINMTSVQLTMNDLQTITRDYPGSWGWFRLVNQSYESMVNKKEIILNLSLNEHPAKYLLFTGGKQNPFLSLDMRHFRLQDRLTEGDFN